MQQYIKFILFCNDTLHVSTCRESTLHVHVCLLASRQQYLSDKCLLLYVQS